MVLKNLSEAEILKQILEYLTIKRYVCWRNNTGAFAGEYKGKKRFVRYGLPGSGDILGLTQSGRFFSLEVKRDGKSPTDIQKDFMNKIEASGGIAFVARSLDDVIGNGF